MKDTIGHSRAWMQHLPPEKRTAIESNRPLLHLGELISKNIRFLLRSRLKELGQQNAIYIFEVDPSANRWTYAHDLRLAHLPDLKGNGILNQYRRLHNTLSEEDYSSTESFLFSESEEQQSIPFLQKMHSIDPTSGFFMAHIYRSLKTESSVLYKELKEKNRLQKNWFPEVVESGARIMQHLDRLFNTLSEKCDKKLSEPVKKRRKEMLKRFLKEFQAILEAKVFELMMVSCGFLLHLKEEDCAVLMSNVKIGNWGSCDEQKQRWSTVKQLIDQNRDNLDSELVKYYDRSMPEDNVLVLPGYISVQDIIEFSHLLEEYFRILGENIASAKRTQRGGKEYVSLSSEDPCSSGIEILCDKRRIGFPVPITSDPNDFIFRIDREKSAQKVSFDFGSLSLDAALRYAEHICSSNFTRDMMRFSQIFGGETVQYPSVFHFFSHVDTAAKAALFANACMRQGEVVGTRQMDKTFSYHDKSFSDEVFQNFPNTIDTFLSLFS